MRYMCVNAVTSHGAEREAGAGWSSQVAASKPGLAVLQDGSGLNEHKPKVSTRAATCLPVCPPHTPHVPGALPGPGGSTAAPLAHSCNQGQGAARQHGGWE